MQLAIHRFHSVAVRQRLSFQRLFASSANIAKPVKTPITFASGDYKFNKKSLQEGDTHHVWEVMMHNQYLRFSIKKPVEPQSPHWHVEAERESSASGWNTRDILTLPRTQEEMLRMFAKGEPIFRNNGMPNMKNDIESAKYWMAEIAQTQSSEGVPADAKVDLLIPAEMLVRLKAFKEIEYAATATGVGAPGSIEELRGGVEYIARKPLIIEGLNKEFLPTIQSAKDTVSSLIHEITCEVFTEENRREETDLDVLKQKLLQIASQKLLGREHQATT